MPEHYSELYILHIYLVDVQEKSPQNIERGIKASKRAATIRNIYEIAGFKFYEP